MNMKSIKFFRIIGYVVPVVLMLVSCAGVPEPAAVAAAPDTGVLSAASALQGRWEGALRVGEAELRIVFRIIQESDGGMQVFMDSPDQGVRDIPVDALKVEDGAVRLEIRKLGVVYEGRKLSDTEIDGVFQQSGMSLPLRLGFAGSISDEPVDTPDILKQAFDALDGQTAVTVVKNGTEIVFDFNGDQPFSVGSSFKLYVLRALQERIQQGAAGWEDVMQLKAELKSLPSGITQNWPAGSPVTLHTLAVLMISISDNTATDHLIHFLDRSAVEHLMPARVRPLLTTLEMFKIKWGVSEDLRASFLAASPAERRELLESLSEVDRNDIVVENVPTLVEKVEWRLTTRELCTLIYDLRDSDIPAINPGLAKKPAWFRAGYKGGSEPGVLNYTHVLQRTEDSPVYSVSTTINNAEQHVPVQEFTDLVTRLLVLVERGWE